MHLVFMVHDGTVLVGKLLNLAIIIIILCMNYTVYIHVKSIDKPRLACNKIAIC